MWRIDGSRQILDVKISIIIRNTYTIVNTIARKNRNGKKTSGGKKFSSVKVAFTFGTRFACASRDFYFYKVSLPLRHNKRAFFSRFYDITRTFIYVYMHTCVFIYKCARARVHTWQRRNKNGRRKRKQSGKSVPSPSSLPSLPFFSKFRCDAKNGIQTNPKDKNQVSRDIKEAGQQTYPRKNLCYDIFPNYSSSWLVAFPFFFPSDFASSVCLIYQKFLKFTK